MGYIETDIYKEKVVRKPVEMKKIRKTSGGGVRVTFRMVPYVKPPKWP